MKLLGPDPNDLWRHRRTLAYTAMVQMIGIGFVVLFRDISASQAEVLGTIAFADAGVVAAYTGFAVMDAASKRSRQSRPDTADALQPAREGD